MSELFTPRDLTNEMIRLSRRLDSDHESLTQASHDYAAAENAYRMARAQAYLRSKGTVDERRSFVDLETENQRIAAHTTEGLKVAALERVRSTRAQLSALQSVANAVRSEVEMAGRL